ncbi:hypothetical protein EVA_05121 [gut metagenome]|uniref:Uncharacterized protein n=1 Tax=gut metagenome TaxID=749906 RepID=J9D2D3_9ZZZZ
MSISTSNQSFTFLCRNRFAVTECGLNCFQHMVGCCDSRVAVIPNTLRTIGVCFRDILP